MISVKPPDIDEVDTELHIPPVVSWILTGLCNMRCVHCYPESEPEYSGPELNREQHFATVDKLANAGVEMVFLSGGEVLTVKHLFELIDKLHQRSIRTWICSNGSLIDEEIADKIVRAGVRGVSISLDSGSSDVHDKFRKFKGAHHRALRAIRILRRKGVDVDIDFTATKANREGLDDLVSTGVDLGAKSIFVKRFRPIGRGAENADDLLLEMVDYRGIIENLADTETGDATSISFEDPAVNAYLRQVGKLKSEESLYAKVGCFAGTVWMGIQPNGDITPCPLVNFPIGNIAIDDFAAVIGESEIMQRIIDRNDRGGACGSCDQRWSCGGCRAHALEESGNLFGADPYCAYQTIESDDGDWLIESYR